MYFIKVGELGSVNAKDISAYYHNPDKKILTVFLKCGKEVIFLCDLQEFKLFLSDLDDYSESH
jgi:hypothetical protein